MPKGSLLKWAGQYEELEKVTERMRKELRPYDGLGRYGGEEFLMVLPGCDAETTQRRADEIRRDQSLAMSRLKGVKRAETDGND